MFYALDVETANPSVSSICQIGIAKFENGVLLNKYTEIIDPEEYFDDFNVEIHGIDSHIVKGAKTFPEIYEYLKNNLVGEAVIHHMPFDKSAINGACIKYKLPELAIRWLDSARIVRRSWPELRERGYGLSNICKKLKIEFKNHDALEDAIAAGRVVQFAIEKTKINIEDWFSELKKRMPSGDNEESNNKIRMDGNSDGPLFGETIVFTGTLSILRKEAAVLAANAGCNVTDAMTKKCTILVVGQQDLDKLAGKDKSTKQIKAEKLIKEGVSIKIIGEDDFRRICKT